LHAVAVVFQRDLEVPRIAACAQECLFKEGEQHQCDSDGSEARNP
jgi:hypothetical protein